MATWQDESGAREWRQAADKADRFHGPGEIGFVRIQGGGVGTGSALENMN
ncbi:hypothetical protein KMT30_03745 [Streptomyces sp. IBSBF 2953]|nr:hypothetical protein [Streptomyces hayashii]